MVIEGRVEVNGQTLEKRDAIGFWDTPELQIKALSKAEILLMDIPMR